MSLPSLFVGGFMFFIILSILWSNGVKEVGASKEEVAMVYLAKDISTLTKSIYEGR
jgi:hypothetical protein